MNSKIVVFILSVFIFFSCSSWISSQSGSWVTIQTWEVKTQTSVVVDYSHRADLIEKMITSWEYDKAEKTLSEENKKDEKNIEILRVYAKLKSSQKKYDEALKYLIKANEISGYKNKQLLYDLWVAYSAVWNQKDAEKYVNEALKIDPNFKFAKDYLSFLKSWNNWTVTSTWWIYSFNWSQIEKLIDDKKYIDADKILQEEYKKDNKNSEVLRLLWRLNSVQKKYSEALKYLIEANKVTNYKNKQLLYDLWVAYSANWNIQDAEKTIKEALKIDPEYKFAKDYLSLLQTIQNDAKPK